MLDGHWWMHFMMSWNDETDYNNNIHKFKLQNLGPGFHVTVSSKTLQFQWMNHSIQETQNSLSLPHMGAPTSPAPILPVMLVQHHWKAKAPLGPTSLEGKWAMKKSPCWGCGIGIKYFSKNTTWIIYIYIYIYLFIYLHHWCSPSSFRGSLWP